MIFSRNLPLSDATGMNALELLYTKRLMGITMDVMIIFFVALSATIPSAANAQVQFIDVTEAAGIETPDTWKYGGPTLADLNGDGRYDLVLNNHHEVPALLFLSEGEDRFVEAEPVMGGDVHGIAAGDYDRDGRIDLVVSMGGGNGTNPQPPRLLRNTGDGFEDRTEAAGIANMGARGRSVRWLDIDLDGDLDLLQINARQLPGETGPRNILFENEGDGTFLYRSSPDFEQFEAERVLVTELNRDGTPDLVTFTPLMVWLGNRDFTFTDATPQWLGALSDAQREFAMAVAEADIDNDGDMDLYVARGKTYYEMANNSLDFDAASGRLDLRDEGNAGEDGLGFVAAGDTVGLQDFFHWPRGIDLVLPVYLGADGTRLDTPVAPVTVAAAEAEGFPDDLEHNGWYLGHLGGQEWRLAWKLDGDLAWGLRASVTGVAAAKPDWTPQERGVQDLLLVNENGRFVDASASLPAESSDNNWGVVTGDFDNDMRADFFIYRFGRLRGRVEDVLLHNTGQAQTAFNAVLDHGANNVAAGGHGDMGAPLDYDRDGWLDILSGSDNPGRWHLYRNQGGAAHSLAILVGKSPQGTDPHGAEIYLTAGGITQFKRVGSRGAVHAQSLFDTVHFGLGEQVSADKVRVRWRDGTEQTLSALDAGGTYAFGEQ